MKRHNNTLNKCPELFYIIGAMLGDGCVYKWKNDYQVSIVGEKEFAEKCAKKISVVVEKQVRIHKDKKRNMWWIKLSHHKLFMLFQKIRGDMNLLNNIMKEYEYYSNSLELIEGFFDAEGCIKIIKEPVRITPKICLDICNTNYEQLELIKYLLLKHLEIEARYSSQEGFMAKDGFYRNKIYHLRIYKKEYIRRFLDNISTTKLKEEKKIYVSNWLNREAMILQSKSI
ncbi:MAG: LAGLIDADG family homing endonuclease [Candidatus Woesearchaeota archaeon]